MIKTEQIMSVQWMPIMTMVRFVDHDKFNFMEILCSLTSFNQIGYYP